jgi:ribosomal-protein-alanine N-acetyltransferase
VNAQVRDYQQALPPRLRTMQEHDLDAVVVIEARSYEFPWSLGIFRDCLRGSYGCWVLEHGNALIGYGVLSVAAGEAHLLNVCISPEARGVGHGGYLVQRMIDRALAHRAERIYLEVRPSNPQAMALYERLGFNEIGRRPRYYPARGGREDAIVMAMELLLPAPHPDPLPAGGERG